jgi:hypothetical protein
VSDQTTASKTFWFHPSSGNFYLIPDDAELPAGDVELRTLTGTKRLVDAEAVKQWAADEASAREHLSGAAREGLAKFSEELGEAWRRGIEKAKASAAVEDSKEAVRAAVAPAEERAKQEFEKVATAFLSELEKLTRELEGAIKGAKPNDADS